MLRVKVLVNNTEIDEIDLINTGHKNGQGEYLYHFRVPGKLNKLEIYHNREDPWHVLVEKALHAMNEFGKGIGNN